ncbi:MAG: hypothetical protein NTU41_04940, partial [Chloroflexi bacterium]|nr:hypothetical protein [Chloroflexota bacterium]
QVSERLQRRVDYEWNRLQQTPISKLSTLSSPNAIAEMVVVRALDRFLEELPPQESLEKELGQKISDEQWRELVEMDGKYLLKELRAMCREKGLRHTGDKKTLAGRLLGYWP